jgi:hypothetical protein
MHLASTEVALVAEKLQIAGLDPAEWWLQSLVEAPLGATGLSVDDALDKYWVPDIYLQVGTLVYDRPMLSWHLKETRKHQAETKVKVKHACYDGEFLAAVHEVEGKSEGKDFKIEVLAFAQVEGDKLRWLKESYWLVEGERTSWKDQWADYPGAIKQVDLTDRSLPTQEPRRRPPAQDLRIAGLPPHIWWESSLTEGVMGTSGLTPEESIDRFWAPDFYCQSGPPEAVHLSDRAMLVWHLDWVRRHGPETYVDVKQTCFDGTHFAALHTVGGPLKDGNDYEVEAMTFTKIENDRIAWLKELVWFNVNDRTSFSDEYEEYPPELAPAPVWRH